MGVKTLYEPGERKHALIEIYRYLLSVATASDLSQPTWRRTLADTLADDPSENGIRGNWLLPKVLNERRGTVDTVSRIFPDTEGNRGAVGIWFLNYEDAWTQTKPEEHNYNLRAWDVQDAPEMMVYVWSERSRLRGQTTLARQADFSTMDRLMQVRRIEWTETPTPIGQYCFNLFDDKRDYILRDTGLVRDLMSMNYRQMMNHSTAQDYQRRFDSRVQMVIETIEVDKKRRAECPIPNN